MKLHRRILILGGARSGKSRTAEELAGTGAGQRIYVATGEALDEEMRERIAHHRSARGASWQTREVPLDLADTLGRETGPDRVVLVDCLTLWLSNLLHAGRDLEQEADLLAEAVGRAAGPLILVSNEVGLGIVPATPLGRTFRDAQGRLNQHIAAACDTVIFVAAGCPIQLKPAPALDVRLG